MKILQKEREKHDFNNVWTQDGRIMYWNEECDRVISNIKIR